MSRPVVYRVAPLDEPRRELDVYEGSPLCEALDRRFPRGHGIDDLHVDIGTTVDVGGWTYIFLGHA